MVQKVNSNAQRLNITLLPQHKNSVVYFTPFYLKKLLVVKSLRFLLKFFGFNLFNFYLGYSKNYVYLNIFFYRLDFFIKHVNTPSSFLLSKVPCSVLINERLCKKKNLFITASSNFFKRLSLSAFSLKTHFRHFLVVSYRISKQPFFIINQRLQFFKTPIFRTFCEVYTTSQELLTLTRKLQVLSKFSVLSLRSRFNVYASLTGYKRLAPRTSAVVGMYASYMF